MHKLFTSLTLVLTPLVGIADRPNILLLVSEDLSPRIEPYGDNLANTPNLAELGSKSIRYTNAFTTAGVCAPSRASLITGQHQISFGAQHMRASTSPLGRYLALPPEHVKAFPELLRRGLLYFYRQQVGLSIQRYQIGKRSIFNLEFRRRLRHRMEKKEREPTLLRDD